MAVKRNSSKPIRPKPMAQKAGVTKNRYGKGGKVGKKKS
jgi:hypothetical protein